MVGRMAVESPSEIRAPRRSSGVGTRFGFNADFAENQDLSVQQNIKGMSGATGDYGNTSVFTHDTLLSES